MCVEGVQLTPNKMVVDISNDKSLRTIKSRVRRGVHLSGEARELDVISNGMPPSSSLRR